MAKLPDWGDGRGGAKITFAPKAGQNRGRRDRENVARLADKGHRWSDDYARERPGRVAHALGVSDGVQQRVLGRNDAEQIRVKSSRRSSAGSAVAFCATRP